LFYTYIDAISSANSTAANLTSNPKKSNGSVPVFNATFMKNKTSDAVKLQNNTVVELKSVKNITTPNVQQNATIQGLVNTTNNSTFSSNATNPVGVTTGTANVAFVKSVEADESKNSFFLKDCICMKVHTKCFVFRNIILVKISLQILISTFFISDRVSKIQTIAKQLFIP